MRSEQSCSTAKAAMAVLATLCLGATLAAQSAPTFKVLHNFTGHKDGGFPQGALMEGPNHQLYGTAAVGGLYGYGVVYEMSKAGKEKVLHGFTFQDGFEPNWGALIRDAAGNLYGVTFGGGNFGYRGVLYELSRKGNETMLHQFGRGMDGVYPYSGVVSYARGNLYGTTEEGGASGAGTVFQVASSGDETLLYSFTGGSDGGYPAGGLVLAADGSFYGCTQYGGAGNLGTVFKVDTAGNLTTLHSFSGSDGATPYDGALALDAAGNIYGTTLQGGSSKGCGGYGCGVVFKLDTTRTETVLHSFTEGSDGARPEAGVVLDANGNLYGTTTTGGKCDESTHGCGTVYKLSKTSQHTVLHNFTGKDGSGPELGGLLLSKNILFGTATGGGAHKSGVVFKITLK
jgi:uncharacterized repeat protein (TIGR03803 family)